MIFSPLRLEPAALMLLLVVFSTQPCHLVPAVPYSTG